MEEVLSGHTRGGVRAMQSEKKDLLPNWMTESQIQDAIRQAYRYGQKLASQGDRVRVSGPSAQGTT